MCVCVCKHAHAYTCVCMVVSVRERERERESMCVLCVTEKVEDGIYLVVSKVAIHVQNVDTLACWDIGK